MAKRKGKIISYEGTDGSGKKTNSLRAAAALNEMGFPTRWLTFPVYDHPFGKMIGGPFLGKPEIGESYFDDPSKVDRISASLLYAAERRYELPLINKILNSGENIIFDRWVDSNKGMQGGKIRDPVEREKFFNWIDELEYRIVGLPRPDIKIFLYMPFDVAMELQRKNNKRKDKVENDEDYLRNSEESYLQLTKGNDWKRINCTLDGTMETLRPIEDISNEALEHILKNLR
ncbi:hypothetical protein B6U91_00240 [Candidatus Pacearchaeota archaeon ex4484_71]|nr:MAG: hypothetical protein B6U91_00240 [Candidatus Pacearchaeota archaeon ex4484_71]